MNNRDIRCEICSKLTIKTSERRQWLLYSCYYYYFLLILLLFIVPFRRSFQKNYISWGKHRSIKYSRGVFRTHSNIYDKAFCANCQWLVAVNYFRKKSSIKDVDRVLNRILNYLDRYWFGMNEIERYSQQKSVRVWSYSGSTRITPNTGTFLRNDWGYGVPQSEKNFETTVDLIIKSLLLPEVWVFYLSFFKIF